MYYNSRAFMGDSPSSSFPYYSSPAPPLQWVLDCIIRNDAANMSTPYRRHARIIIVGAGIFGLSTAYYLAEDGQ